MSDYEKTIETIRRMARDAVGEDSISAARGSAAHRALLAIYYYCLEKLNHGGSTSTGPEEDGEGERRQSADRRCRTAGEFLTAATSLMDARGKEYDSPEGERSMGKAVTALNALTGRDLSEAEGWLLMSLIKRARQYATPKYHADSAEDGVAYASLEAEALEKDHE
jgi:hypothetical protein